MACRSAAAGLSVAVVCSLAATAYRAGWIPNTWAKPASSGTTSTDPGSKTVSESAVNVTYRVTSEMTGIALSVTIPPTEN
jgi:hypothetical protein